MAEPEIIEVIVAGPPGPPGPEGPEGPKGDAGNVSVAAWSGADGLSAIAPLFIGQVAFVSSADAGTHVGRTAASPGADVPGVTNAGRYGGYALAPGAWRRDGDLSATGLASPSEGVAGARSDVAMTPEGDKAALDARIVGATFASASAPDSDFLLEETVGTAVVGGVLKDGSRVFKASSRCLMPATMPVDQGWVSSPDLVFWGDSITANLPLAAVRSAFPLIGVTGRGQGAQTSGAIVARQGGLPLLVTLSGNQIPASGAVTVTSLSEDVNRNAGAWDSASGSQTAYEIAGIKGALVATGVAPSVVYTFTRYVPGDVVAVPPNSVCTPLDAAQQAAKTMYLWVGHNDTSGVDTRENILKAIDYLTPTIKRLRVLTLISDGAGPQSINSWIKSTLPTHFVFDMRSILMTRGLSDCGLTATAEDTAAIAAGNIPPQLRGGDTIHPTANTNSLCIVPAIIRDYRAMGWSYKG